MENAIRQLSSYMKRCQDAYEVIANNVANGSSNGFKKILTVERDNSQETVADLTQGRISHTGNPLDVAIDGEGFFAVKTAQGKAFTRCGSFHVDSSQRLLSVMNEPVLNSMDEEIKLTGPVNINSRGEIFSGDKKVADLAFVKPLDDSEIVAIAGGKYLFEAGPIAPEVRRVEGGALEDSNVDPLEEMTRIISLGRDIEIAEKALKMSFQADEKGASDIGNTGK